MGAWCERACATAAADLEPFLWVQVFSAFSSL